MLGETEINPADLFDLNNKFYLQFFSPLTAGSVLCFRIKTWVSDPGCVQKDMFLFWLFHSRGKINDVLLICGFSR